MLELFEFGRFPTEWDHSVEKKTLRIKKLEYQTPGRNRLRDNLVRKQNAWAAAPISSEVSPDYVEFGA
jgi:hypothetical protein